MPISNAAGGVIQAAVSSGAGLLSGWTAGSEAKKARKWQAVRFRRRYQDTMRDMRLAGLNPILAAEQSPGNAGPGAQADYSDAIGHLSQGFSSALDAAGKISANKAIKAEARKAGADADVAEAEARLRQAQIDYIMRGGKSTRSIDISAFGGKVGAWSREEEGIKPLYQRLLDSELGVQESSAEANRARAKADADNVTIYNKLSDAQVKQLDNAVEMNNMDAATRLYWEVGLKAFMSLAEFLAAVGLKKTPPGTIPIPSRGKVGF